MKQLSILICSLDTRKELLARLLKVLNPQLTEKTELIIETDNGQMTIGQKRNRLLARATGRSVVYIDDDDLISSSYVEQIVNAIETSDADVIGFKTKRYMDGRFEGEGIHSLRYKEYGEHQEQGKRIFERTPNHLNPVRTKIAKSVGFNNVNFGEDSEYAKAIYPLLKTELFIDDYLYSYYYRRIEHRNEITNELKKKYEQEQTEKELELLIQRIFNGKDNN